MFYLKFYLRKFSNKLVHYKSTYNPAFMNVKYDFFRMQFDIISVYTNVSYEKKTIKVLCGRWTMWNSSDEG